MTFLAFASILFAFIVSVASIVLAFNSPSAPSLPTEKPVKSVSIAFEMHTPASATTTLPLQNVKRIDRIQRRFNVIAQLASRECAADSIEWATAKDAITGKFSVNPLCLSRRAKFGYENVFEGAACAVRCQELLANYDVDAALSNW